MLSTQIRNKFFCQIQQEKISLFCPQKKIKTKLFCLKKKKKKFILSKKTNTKFISSKKIRAQFIQSNKTNQGKVYFVKENEYKVYCVNENQDTVFFVKDVCLHYLGYFLNIILFTTSIKQSYLKIKYFYHIESKNFKDVFINLSLMLPLSNQIPSLEETHDVTTMELPYI